MFVQRRQPRRALQMAGLFAVAVSTVLLGVRQADAQTAAANEFQAGAFAMDITPEEFPISMNGSMSDKIAESAHDRLHARCLVLDDGTTRIALVVCDSCMIPREIFDVAKRMASDQTGIPPERMLMSATHTHTAPTVTGVFQSDPDEEYRKFLARRIAAGIERACAQMRPARIAWGVAHDPTQVFNRRWLLKPGVIVSDPFGGTSDTARMNPGYGNANKVRPAGTVDPEICFLSVVGRDGQPIALLANYSLHYVGGVPAGAVSGDYFGEFARRVTQRIGAAQANPPFVGILSNGTSGDINNVDYSLDSSPARLPFEQIQVVAASVADAVARAYGELEYRDWVPLDVREAELELAVRLPSAEDEERARTILEEAGSGPYGALERIYARETVLLAEYPPAVRAKLQALRIGPVGIVSSPCETFVETGLAIKKLSPLRPTFVIELANGYNGYLPTAAQHELGGYETWRARSSYLSADSESKIRSTLLRLLQELAKADESR